MVLLKIQRKTFIWKEVEAGCGALRHASREWVFSQYNMLISQVTQLESKLKGEVQLASQVQVILRYKETSFFKGTTKWVKRFRSLNVHCNYPCWFWQWQKSGLLLLCLHWLADMLLIYAIILCICSLFKHSLTAIFFLNFIILREQVNTAAWAMSTYLQRSCCILSDICTSEAND